MMERVTLPSDKPWHVKERKNFPDLNVQYIPGIFTEQHLANMFSFLQKLDYTNVVESTPSESSASGVHHAWVADFGEWHYAVTCAQQNAFIPLAWPMWLREAGHKVSNFIRENGNRDFVGLWSACLVTRIARSSDDGADTTTTYRQLARDCDVWNAPGTAVCSVLVPDPGPMTMTTTMFAMDPVSLDLGKTGICVDGPHPGAVFVVHDAKTRSSWDMSISVEGNRVLYCLTFLRIDPLSVTVHNLKKLPLRTKAGIAAQQRLVPVALQGQEKKTKRAKQNF